jgi:hypothetical protein
MRCDPSLCFLSSISDCPKTPKQGQMILFEVQSTAYVLLSIYLQQMEWCPRDTLSLTQVTPSSFLMCTHSVINCPVLLRGESPSLSNAPMKYGPHLQKLKSKTSQDFATVVDCIPGTWSEERPKRYEPISVSLLVHFYAIFIIDVDLIFRLRNT